MYDNHRFGFFNMCFVHNKDAHTLDSACDSKVSPLWQIIDMAIALEIETEIQIEIENKTEAYLIAFDGEIKCDV